MFASTGRDGQSLLHGDNGRWEGILGSRAEESKFLSVWVQLPSASAKHTPAGAARNHSRNRVKVQNHRTCCATNLCSSVKWPKHTCYLCESHSHTQDFTPVKPAGDKKRGRREGKPRKTPFSQMFWTKACMSTCNKDLPRLGNEAGPQVSLLQQSLKFFPYSTLWMLTSSPLP